MKKMIRKMSYQIKRPLTESGLLTTLKTLHQVDLQEGGENIFKEEGKSASLIKAKGKVR